MRIPPLVCAFAAIAATVACSGGDGSRPDPVVVEIDSGVEAAPTVVEIETGVETAPPVPFPEPGELGLLAFIRDGNVWVKALPDGAEVRLTAAGGYSSPTWSRDGTWLAVDRPDQLERWLFGQDGSRVPLWEDGPQCAADADPAECLRVQLALAPVEIDPELLLPGRAWSDDGRFAAIAIGAGPPPGSPAAAASPERAGKPGELLVLDLASGATWVLATAEQPTGAFLPLLWSPDGRYVIAHERPDQSASRMAGGLALRAIDVATGGVTELPFTLLYSDSVVPGGAGVAAIAGGGREAWTGKRLQIVTFPPDGPPVSAEPAGVPEGAVASPSWAPDGTRLAYVVGPDLGHVGGGEPARNGLMLRRIYVHDLETGEVRRLLDDAAYRDEHPEWSRDGDDILFARFDTSDGVSVWVASTGSDPAPRMVADGLSVDPETTWFGYYGHVDWDAIYDWWQPAE